MSHFEDETVPVLNSVVESGNESIIQSSRLSREVMRELRVLQEEEPVRFVLHDHIVQGNDNEDKAESRVNTNSDGQSRFTGQINPEIDVESDFDGKVDAKMSAVGTIEGYFNPKTDALDSFGRQNHPTIDTQSDLISQTDPIIDDSSHICAESAPDDEAIEIMIDEVVDRHITELRKDIRRLLMQIKQQT